MRTLWRQIGTCFYWMLWPALYVYLRSSARTRVLVLAEDHVLLVQSWLGPTKWQLTGGGLHHREQPEVGAVREVGEETGVRIDVTQLQTLGSEWCTDGGIKVHYHFFVVRLDKRTAIRRQPGEIVAVAWVPLSDLKTVPHKTDVVRALELLAAKH